MAYNIGECPVIGVYLYYRAYAVCKVPVMHRFGEQLIYLRFYIFPRDCTFNKLPERRVIRITGNGTLAAVEVATGTAAKLYNLADVAVSKNTQVYGGATGTLVVNSNTVFLVRSGADTTANPYTFKSITGFTNIDNYAKGEVDYVDLNGDNVADYVYVIAPTTTSKVTSLFDNAETVGDVKIASAYFTGTTGDTLRGMCDSIRDKAVNPVVAVLVCKAEDKITMAVTVNKLAQEKGLKAGVLVKELAAIAGGKGGGKPDFAMAGLKDETKIDEALAAVKGIVEKQLG